MNDTTLMVKTMFRPEGLRALLYSIRKQERYKTTPIYIADDTNVPYPEVVEDFPGPITYRSYDYDAGIGRCMNVAVDEIDSEYVVLLEDDFEFEERTDLSLMLKHVKMGIFDICGGAVFGSAAGIFQRFVGELAIRDQQLTMNHLEPSKVKWPIKVDVCLNFFLSRTETLRRLRWDEDLKVARHVDFFLRAKQRGMTVGYHPDCVILHRTLNDKPAYLKNRQARLPEFQRMFLDKWNLVQSESPVT